MLGPITSFLLGLFVSWFFDAVIFKKRRSSLAVLPGPKSDSIIAGNLKSVHGPEGADYLEKMTDTYGGIVKFHGLVGTDWELFITDPDAVQKMLATDEVEWSKASLSIYLNTMMFGPGLSSVHGETHRRQRKAMTPIFSTEQMRAFVPIFHEVSRHLCRKVQEGIMEQTDSSASQSEEGTSTFDIVRLSSRTALDIVGKSAIGYDFGTIERDNEYSLAVKRLMPAMGDLGPAVMFMPFLSRLGPWSIREPLTKLFFPLLGSFGKTAQSYLNIIDILTNKTAEIFTEKKREMSEVGLDTDKAKDVISTLLRDSKRNVEDALVDTEIKGQIQVMIFAGHETTANAIAGSLHHLSHDTKIQDKLRLEIAQAKVKYGSGDLDYDAIHNLPFLDAFVREILRLYPPVPMILRQSAQETVLTTSTPFKSAKDERFELGEVVVPRNTRVMIGLQAMNRSFKTFGPDAKEFKPERWLGASGKTIKEAGEKLPGVYSNIMTFAGGPRSCIGFKFATLEIKVVLLSLLQSFSFSPVHDDADIKWISKPLTFPIIRGQEDKGPQLPMKITAL